MKLLLDIVIVLALIGFVLGRIVYHATRGAPRRRALWIARTLPFALTVYLVLCLFLWATAHNRWDAPILGNYHLFMINTTDSAAIYDHTVPGAFDHGGVMQLPDHPEIIFGVHLLEVRPPYLIGIATPTAYANTPQTPVPFLFFILDTRTGVRTDESSFAGLEAVAQKLGSPPKFERVDAVYRRNHRKLGRTQYLLFAIPPLIGIFFMIRALIQMRALTANAPNLSSAANNHPIG